MRRLVFLSALVIAHLCRAQAQKIKVEYDKSFDFSKYKTYGMDANKESAKPMLRLAILGAIQDDLTKRGLQQVADNPDIFVQVYGATDHDFTTHYHDPLYGRKFRRSTPG